MCGTSEPCQTADGSLMLETQLTRPVSSRTRDSRRQHCSNGYMFNDKSAQRLIDIAVTSERRTQDFEACVGAKLLVHVGTFCLQSGLVACEHPQCVSQASLLRQNLPQCNWNSFREWLITAIACWIFTRTTDGKLVEPVGLLDTDVFMWVFEILGTIDAHPAALQPCLDIAGVLSLQHWIVLAGSEPSARYKSRSASFIATMNDIYQPYITQRLWQCRQAAQLQKYGICPARLGNLLLSSENQHMMLVAILQGLNQSSFPRSGANHSSCTEQLCMFAEDNSTNIIQLHKCFDELKCCHTVFPPDDLQELLSKDTGSSWVCTAWDVWKWAKYSTGKSPLVNTLLLGQPSRRYVAISHVWSDGTGVGISSPGKVNSCLAEYFARIAVRLGCDGLWWDSICVPSGREEKRKAMDRMLDNYANATYTIIHDLSLVNFEWKDDGTPAIAVILSAWYTRGWTATELFSTRQAKGSVKVLFKDPNPSNTEPLIKDLDTEVLTPVENYSGLLSGRVPNHAHLSASSIIRCIRHSESEAKIKSLPDLMRILRPRTTSWAKDRIILAALLCLPSDDVNTSRTISRLTMDILQQLRKFPVSYLFHGEAPISTFGPFSWCPPSLFDLGKTTSLTAAYVNTERFTLGFGQAKYLNFGVLRCTFNAFSLSDARDSIGILPYASHPSVVTKIKIALTTPLDCVLVRTRDQGNGEEQTINMWILAHRVPRPTNLPLLREIERNEVIVGEGFFLRWIGCVICRKPRYSKYFSCTTCFFGLDVDEQGFPLRTISPFHDRACV